MTETHAIYNGLFSADEFLVDWRDLEFSHPERKIRLATSFSGIGAIEHAFQRLGLNCEIVFAGDVDDKCKKSYFANYHITEE